MTDCIFCKIVDSKIPSSKVYEDKDFLAFLDIMPVNKGHVLVIPKKHYVNLFDIPEEVLADLIKIVKKVAGAVKSGVNADGINLMQSNGVPAGQEVMHIHFHIMPRFKEDELKHWPRKKYVDSEMDEYKDLIKKFLE